MFNSKSLQLFDEIQKLLNLIRLAIHVLENDCYFLVLYVSSRIEQKLVQLCHEAEVVLAPLSVDLVGCFVFDVCTLVSKLLSLFLQVLQLGADDRLAEGRKVLAHNLFHSAKRYVFSSDQQLRFLEGPDVIVFSIHLRLHVFVEIRFDL